MNPYAIPWMDDDLEMFRDTVVRFVESEMLPLDAGWREQHHVDRATWLKAGDTGLLLLDVPGDYGGGGGDSVTKPSCITSWRDAVSAPSGRVCTACVRTTCSITVPSSRSSAGCRGSPRAN